MVESINNIRQQARQGSMAAIIQLLNEQLADTGVRTRAVFADGALQLLCEAATPEQLEPEYLVERIQEILDAIAPRNIRRVNLLARIVREQQLLWFDEINRDREAQLLWSRKIKLKRANFFEKLKQGQPDKTYSSNLAKEQSLPKFAVGSRPNKYKTSFWQGLGGGVLVMILLLIGWQIYQGRESEPTATIPSPTEAPQVATIPTPREVEPSVSPEIDPNPSPFVAAVELAQEAAVKGTEAQTSAEWLALAAQWEQASDLMSQVSSEDSRYAIAQDRVITYRRNSESAQVQAKR